MQEHPKTQPTAILWKRLDAAGGRNGRRMVKMVEMMLSLVTNSAEMGNLQPNPTELSKIDSMDAVHRLDGGGSAAVQA